MDDIWRNVIVLCKLFTVVDNYANLYKNICKNYTLIVWSPIFISSCASARPVSSQLLAVTYFRKNLCLNQMFGRILNTSLSGLQFHDKYLRGKKKDVMFLVLYHIFDVWFPEDIKKKRYWIITATVSRLLESEGQVYSIMFECFGQTPEQEHGI